MHCQVMADASAFSQPLRSRHDHDRLDPPLVHMAAYVTGGLKKLYSDVKSRIQEPIHDYGFFTDNSGCFKPKDNCILAWRYQVTKVLSVNGQSSVIVSAMDSFRDNREVVIKVLHVRYYSLGVQESHFLRLLALADSQRKSRTIRMLTTFTFDDHYCIVFEPLEPESLLQVFNCVSSHELVPNIVKVTSNLLQALGFLRQQNIIHADLKPENILFKDNNDLNSLKIVDFGNAINHAHQELSLYYENFDLQTPLYRAPEVIFGIPFGSEIDMWSLGCILTELYTGKPLFMASNNEDLLMEWLVTQ